MSLPDPRERRERHEALQSKLWLIVLGLVVVLTVARLWMAG